MSSAEGCLVGALFVNLLANLWQRPEIVSLHVQNYVATKQHKGIPRNFHGSLTEAQNGRSPDSQAIGLPVFIEGDIRDISNLVSKGIGHRCANQFCCKLVSLDVGFAGLWFLRKARQRLPLSGSQQRWM